MRVWILLLLLSSLRTGEINLSIPDTAGRISQYSRHRVDISVFKTQGGYLSIPDTGWISQDSGHRVDISVFQTPGEYLSIYIASDLRHDLLCWKLHLKVLQLQNHIHDGQEGLGLLREISVSGFLLSLQFSQ